MSFRSNRNQCTLACPWRGTEMCVCSYLSPELIAERHISLGVMQGIKSLYPPGALPSCVTSRGDLDWSARHNYLAELQKMEREHNDALVHA